MYYRIIRLCPSCFKKMEDTLTINWVPTDTNLMICEWDDGDFACDGHDIPDNLPVIKLGDECNVPSEFMVGFSLMHKFCATLADCYSQCIVTYNSGGDLVITYPQCGIRDSNDPRWCQLYRQSTTARENNYECRDDDDA